MWDYHSVLREYSSYPIDLSTRDKTGFSCQLFPEVTTEPSPTLPHSQLIFKLFICLLGGAWVTLVMHLTQCRVLVPWGWVLSWDNLGMGTCISPRRVISLQLLIQQIIFLYLPWLSAAVQFINCKVPPSSFCKRFDRACLWCLHPAPLSISIISGKLGMLTAFHPGSSNHIFPCNFCTIIFFYLQSSFHTLQDKIYVRYRG